MTTSRVIYWERTPHDTRDTASSTNEIEVNQAVALSVARTIDSEGELPEGVKPAFDHPGYQPAVGHGVTIIYASGRRREVRVSD